MYNDEVNDEDIPTILEYLIERGEDVEEFMKSSYRELVFLGTSPKKIGGELLDASLFNLRLCIHYYLLKEEYTKVSHLKKIYDSILNPTTKVEVDEDLLRSISVCEN